MAYAQTSASLLLASLATTIAATQAAFAAPGYKTASLEVQHRSVPLDLHIWYPAKQGGKITTLGKNAVFTGVDVLPDSAPEAGEHPLVVLSHGSGGNAVNIAWIAAELADRGMVVIAPNHPGTTSRDSRPDQTIKVWERPADFSAILDVATEKGFGSIKVDKSNIGAVGFSLGGHTVLSLAGAEVRKKKFIEYCDNYSTMLDCVWLRHDGLDLKTMDAARFEKSNKDPRIKTVVAIDPALAHAYDSKSLNAITASVKLINLGDTTTIPLGIDAKPVKGEMPQAQLINISQATHFSFLGQCTKIGKYIILGAGEDPICTETGNRSRADIHQELKAKIGDFLQAQLSQRATN